jgi:hypothetical protein
VVLPPVDTNTSSTNWKISDVKVVCDILTLDSGLDSQYSQYLLEGRALPINFNSYITMLQSTANSPNVNINIARAVSRLKTVFITLDNSDRIRSRGYDANAFT